MPGLKKMSASAVCSVSNSWVHSVPIGLADALQHHHTMAQYLHFWYCVNSSSYHCSSNAQYFPDADLLHEETVTSSFNMSDKCSEMSPFAPSISLSVCHPITHHLQPNCLPDALYLSDLSCVSLNLSVQLLTRATHLCTFIRLTCLCGCLSHSHRAVYWFWLVSIWQCISS